MNSLVNTCEENKANRTLPLVVVLIAFHPKALIINLIKAGILTYSTFNPFPFNRTVVYYQKHLTELTATGIVPDLHWIPF